MYLQILIFSINNVYIMFVDKVQFMIFSTGNIYKSTGTSSKNVEDQNYSDTLQRELAEINAHTTIRRMQVWKSARRMKQDKNLIKSQKTHV